MFPLPLLLALLWLFPFSWLLKRARLCILTPENFIYWFKEFHSNRQSAKAHWTFPYCVKIVSCILAPQFWEFNVKEMCSKVYDFGAHIWSCDNKGTVTFVTTFETCGSIQNFTNFPSLELNSKWSQKMWNLSKLK